MSQPQAWMQDTSGNPRSFPVWSYTTPVQFQLYLSVGGKYDHRLYPNPHANSVDLELSVARSASETEITVSITVVDAGPDHNLLIWVVLIYVMSPESSGIHL